MHPSSPSCAAFAEVLPLLADGVATPVTAAAQVHVRDCLTCQRTLAQYQGIDDAVRRYYARVAPPTRQPEEMMDFITQNMPERPPATLGAAARSPRRWPRAISAAFIVGLLAVLLGAFALMRVPSRPVATVTAAPNTLVEDVSMISPTEGWAIANSWNSTWDLDLPNTWNNSTLYHYAHGVWLPQSIKAPAFIAVHLQKLHMFSATDGWALGDVIVTSHTTRRIVLHYDGKTWSPIADDGQATPDHVAGFIGYQGFNVLSDASLWVASFVLSTSAQQTKLPAIGHLINGHTWLLEDLPLPYQGVNINLVVLSLAIVNDDEGWAAVRISGTSSSGQPSTDRAMLYHRLHGKWNIDTTITSDFGFFAHVTMASATEGWAVGPHVDTTTNDASLLLYHYSGGKWAPQTLPRTSAVGDALLCGITAQHGWIVQNSQPLAAYAYDGSQWQFAHTISSDPKDAITVYACSFATPDDGWAVGYGAHIMGHTPTEYPVFLHEKQGSWSVYVP